MQCLLHSIWLVAFAVWAAVVCVSIEMNFLLLAAIVRRETEGSLRGLIIPMKLLVNLFLLDGLRGLFINFFTISTFFTRPLKVIGGWDGWLFGPWAFSVILDWVFWDWGLGTRP